MDLVIQPVICNKCVSLLQTVYMFKLQCLKIEENILRHAQAVGKSKINLMEYHKRRISNKISNDYYKGRWIFIYVLYIRLCYEKYFTKSISSNLILGSLIMSIMLY